MARLMARTGALVATLVLGFAVLAAPPAGATEHVGGAFGSTPLGKFHTPFDGTPKSVCGSVTAGDAACLSWVLQNGNQPSTGSAVVNAPTGLSPSVIDSVYGFSSATSGGSGQTIAIVDAYDDPNAANDLATFSTEYHLPTAVLRKVNEYGTTAPLPASDPNWALEISLDIEWAHAIAPGASILLVEANSSSLSDLLTAEQLAAEDANYVSNSWGSSEFGGESNYDSYLTSPAGRHVSYFAATGDSGGAIDYPATSPNVVAVGGTSLKFTNSNALASETAWSGGGGGCSAYETAPSAQSSFSQYSQVGCNGKRAVPDVSMEADPNSGVSIYDSTTYDGSSGWWTVGGTSVGTPIWAAESAVLGSVVSPATVYGSSIPFRDIVSGSNGHPALIGYDLATGRGSWAYTPGTITGLTAAAGNGVTLSWTAPTGAPISSYNIWRGTSSGGETELAHGATGTSYPDTSASSGTKYFYEVQGLNSAGSGPFSNEASATASGSAPAIPGAPTGLSASYASGQVSLSWTAPIGSVVTSYNVLRGTASGQESPLTSVTGKTTYSDTTATAPGTYYYEVQAVNSAGVAGPTSNEASAPVPSSSPPPPTGPGPAANFSVTCALNTCTFTSTSTDSSGTIITYSWSSTDGVTGTTRSIQHTYATGGSDTVSLTVTDSNGRNSSNTASIECSQFFAWVFCS